MQTEKQRERLVELLNEAAFGVNVHTLADHLSRETIERVAEYLMANNVVVLPCKIGDKAYYVDKGRMRETTVREIYFYTNNSWNMMLEFGCEEECDDCPFESWSQSYCGEWSCGGEYGTWTVDNDDFGKTVFLSKEEAENVLKERKENAR